MREEGKLPVATHSDQLTWGTDYGWGHWGGIIYQWLQEAALDYSANDIRERENIADSLEILLLPG